MKEFIVKTSLDSDGACIVKADYFTINDRGDTIFHTDDRIVAVVSGWSAMLVAEKDLVERVQEKNWTDLIFSFAFHQFGLTNARNLFNSSKRS